MSIRVAGEIDEASSQRFLAALRAVRGPATVVVDSVGGRVRFALEMAAAIEQRGDVHAEVRKADSAALALVAAAATRSYPAGATALAHDVVVQFGGKLRPQQLLDQAAEVAGVDAKFVALLARRSGKPAAYWRDLQARDVVLDAGQLARLFPSGTRAAASGATPPVSARVEQALERMVARIDWRAKFADALVDVGYTPIPGRHNAHSGVWEPAHLEAPGVRTRRWW